MTELAAFLIGFSLACFPAHAAGYHKAKLLNKGHKK